MKRISDSLKPDSLIYLASSDEKMSAAVLPSFLFFVFSDSKDVTIQPANRGTIIYEVENLGRRLILVPWDGSSSTYAFPDEVDIRISESFLSKRLQSPCSLQLYKNITA